MFENQKTMMLALLSLVLLVAEFAAAEHSVTLTKDNFDQMTSGKSVFIKWFAPWCGHCKELAPAWDQMASEWVNHKDVLVGAVDCTQNEDQKEWCISMGITGFPTLTYGDPSQGGFFLEQYEESKSYEDLSAFAKDTLTKPLCSPATYDGCDKKTKTKLEKLWKMTTTDLEKAIQEKENAMKQAEIDFQKTFEKMQKDYDKQSKDYEISAAKMRSNIKLLRAIKETI